MGEPTVRSGASLVLVVGLVAVIVVAGCALLDRPVVKTVGRSGGAPVSIYEMPGDWDVACTASPDGNPAGCSTPLPSLEPAAVAAAKPLDIPALDVPVTKTGPMRVDLGEATLANGVLHEASFHLDGIPLGVQELPSGITVGGRVRLTVTSTDPSRPQFGNGYARGWHPGVEAVRVQLLLDVTSFEPGFVLKIRDVVVR